MLPEQETYYQEANNPIKLLNRHLDKINGSGNPSIKMLSDGTQVRSFNTPEEAKAYANKIATGQISQIDEYFNMHDGQISPEFEQFLKTRGRRVTGF